MLFCCFCKQNHYKRQMMRFHKGSQVRYTSTATLNSAKEAAKEAHKRRGHVVGKHKPGSQYVLVHWLDDPEDALHIVPVADVQSTLDLGLPATHYITKVVTFCPTEDGKKWSRHGRVAVLEVDAGLEDVSGATTRARGVHRVVQEWDRVPLTGRTQRSRLQQVLTEANKLAAKLNADAAAVSSLIG